MNGSLWILLAVQFLECSAMVSLFFFCGIIYDAQVVFISQIVFGIVTTICEPILYKFREQFNLKSLLLSGIFVQVVGFVLLILNLDLQK